MPELSPPSGGGAGVGSGSFGAGASAGGAASLVAAVVASAAGSTGGFTTGFFLFGLGFFGGSTVSDAAATLDEAGFASPGLESGREVTAMADVAGVAPEGPAEADAAGCIGALEGFAAASRAAAAPRTLAARARMASAPAPTAMSANMRGMMMRASRFRGFTICESRGPGVSGKSCSEEPDGAAAIAGIVPFGGAIPPGGASEL